MYITLTIDDEEMESLLKHNNIQGMSELFSKYNYVSNLSSDMKTWTLLFARKESFDTFYIEFLNRR